MSNQLHRTTPAGVSSRPDVGLHVEQRRPVDQVDAGGVFAVLSLEGSIDGRPIERILATAHPSGTRMTWLDDDGEEGSLVTLAG